MLPEPALRDALKADLKKMIDEGMFFGEVPEFDHIMAVLADLEKQINADAANKTGLE